MSLLTFLLDCGDARMRLNLRLEGEVFDSFPFPKEEGEVLTRTEHIRNVSFILFHFCSATKLTTFTFFKSLMLHDKHNTTIFLTC